MSSQETLVPKKKRGPKPTGHGLQLSVRVHEPLIKALDEWADNQEDRPSRPEAIRRILEEKLLKTP